MYIAYIDESGKPNRTDPENFVLASVIINESNWQFIDQKINEIKQKHFPSYPLDQVEFHVKDMMNKTGIYNGRKIGEIFDILDDIFNLITNNPNCFCVIASYIDKPRVYEHVNMETWAFRLLIERIDLYLNKMNDMHIKNKNPLQYGMMIIDSVDESFDNKIRKKVSNMMKHGTLYLTLQYLIEEPIFIDSKWRNLSQLTDCVAYCIRRYYKHPVSKGYIQQKWVNYFTLINPVIDADANGNILGYGIKIFPPQKV